MSQVLGPNTKNLFWPEVDKRNNQSNHNHYHNMMVELSWELEWDCDVML